MTNNKLTNYFQQSIESIPNDLTFGTLQACPELSLQTWRVHWGRLVNKVIELNLTQWNYKRWGKTNDLF